MAAKKPQSPGKRKTTRAARNCATVTGKPRKSPLKEEVIEAAKDEGLLPHEILLKAARGEKFVQKVKQVVMHKSGPQKGTVKEVRWVDEDYYPNFNEQVECARSAAPYYAPRLATQTVKTDEKTADALVGVMKKLADALPG